MVHEHLWLFYLGEVISSCFLASLFENCLYFPRFQRRIRNGFFAHHNPALTPIFKRLPFPLLHCKACKSHLTGRTLCFLSESLPPIGSEPHLCLHHRWSSNDKWQPQALTDSCPSFLGQKVTDLSPRNHQIKQSIDPYKLHQIAASNGHRKGEA